MWGPSWLKGLEVLEPPKPRLETARKAAGAPVAVPTTEPSSTPPEASCAKPGPSGDPLPLPWRETVAGWPTPWRERWGLRANELEAAGLDWRSAEQTAFDEMTAEDDE